MKNLPFDDAQNRNTPQNTPKNKTLVMIETEHGCIDVTLDSLIESDEAFEKDLPMTRSEEQKNRVVSNLMSRLWNETTPIPEAPHTSDVSSPTWSTTPSSSLEYSAYKKKIQASVSFESVVGKVNPYTGFKIKTLADYDLYCDFLIQQKINDAKLDKAKDRITQLEKELSSFQTQSHPSEVIPSPKSEASQIAFSTQRSIQDNSSPLSKKHATNLSYPVKPPVRESLSNNKRTIFACIFIIVLLVFLELPLCHEKEDNSQPKKYTSSSSDSFLSPEEIFDAVAPQIDLDALQPIERPELSEDTSVNYLPEAVPIYVGNSSSKVFHNSNCSYLPSEENQIFFPSRLDAVNDGYSPCGHCNP